MAIQTAVQRGNSVYVYDEKGQQIFSRFGELHGYTQSGVSVKYQGLIRIYNEKGIEIRSYHA
jgi:hypothetical protein